ncbi:PSD1 and planctomycete cytochrome C domain-containing protein [Botrimarina sp.]|uniref:PSD1 and planctomycete cytochrome C domain-containing protein n=1 Tax=Botrimarina sp. TaxID=2795802 RepID=UPI0032EEDFAC
MLCFTLLDALLSTAAARAAEPAPSFAHEVRPLLSDRCFGCHGPGTQEAALRLDTQEGATEWAILPGDSESSEVIARVSLPEGDDLRMPPEHAGKPPLSREEVDLLRRWIDAGASYGEHWAFAPIEKPSPPDGEAGASEIDRFLNRRIEEKGLAIQPQADKRTLARRLTLDLTGLPPTPAEVEAFVSDDSPEAYERLVDRLLASPRYGEHRARYWLDAVRYGDTHGKHLDNYREIWPYRDWVVAALNANKPYDEFLVEQIAGDLLPDPTREQLIATGFNRCNVSTAEGGVIEQEIYTDNVRDRVDAFGTVVLGLTVGCAKCHDHKYDPLSRKEYYSLFAFFNSIDGGPNDGNVRDHAPAIRVPSDQQQARLEELQAKLGGLRRVYLRDDPRLDAAQRDWEDALVALAGPGVAEALVPTPVLYASEWRTAGPFTDNLKNVVHGAAPAETDAFDPDQTWTLKDGRTVGWEVRPDWVDGRPHAALPGRLASNVVCRTITVDRPTEVEVAVRSDDSLRVKLNGAAVYDHKAQRPLSEGPDRFKMTLKPGDNFLTLRVGNVEGPSGFEFEVLDATVLPTELVDIAGTAPGERSETDALLIRQAFRARTAEFPELEDLRQQVAAVEAEWLAVDRSVPSTLIFRERPEPRVAYDLLRGEYDAQGDPVERRVPAFLPALPGDAPQDRLGLARWAVSEDQPLTARVAVNRYWRQLFGVGLVQTAEDFGSQGSPPSHPELLDWLAADFVRHGWDVKRLFKQLVTTEAYRRSSSAAAEAWRDDPPNRWLARGPRHRLDAEVLRDQALAASGLLVERLGGPPVRPPQPGGLWKAVAYEASDTAEFVADTAPEKVHRRSLYTFYKRTSPPPQFTVLDAPTRESCTIRRERTNTPLQALMLMNDPQYVEAARGLAERVLRWDGPPGGGPTDTARAARMLLLATGRPADETEAESLAEGYRGELRRYRGAPEAAAALVSIGAAPPDPALDTAELAAWTMTANLVLNLDEVVTKN